MGDQPVVKSYAEGIAARSAERQDERKRVGPLIPNLAQAVETYRPEHGVQTMQQMAEAQRNGGPSGPQAPAPHALRPETIEGLKMLHAAETAARAEAPAEPIPVPKPAPPPQALPEEEEDEELSAALRMMKENVIQSERERKAIAERVKEIDISEGLLTGEFTQLVPVVPGKFEVRYRCLTRGENDELRMLLLEDIRLDSRKSSMGQDLLGFYQTVASVLAINGNSYAKHMVPNEYGHLTFRPEVFREKLAIFRAFPLPMIASLGTHGAWFEQRVRELFITTDALKNG